MAKYICGVCGYVYDEDKEGPFSNLKDDWKCPVCKASKSVFKKEETQVEGKTEFVFSDGDSLKEVSDIELSGIFSNLARGSEKLYNEEARSSFQKLADYYVQKLGVKNGKFFDDLLELNNKCDEYISNSQSISRLLSDRGALRVATWAGKVSAMQKAILNDIMQYGISSFKDKKVWVCDVCGFIYIGENPPSVCPVCKVPNFKILEVK